MKGDLFYFQYSMVHIFMLIFLSLASMIWEWVKDRKWRKKNETISRTMNCLLSGLGSFTTISYRKEIY